MRKNGVKLSIVAIVIFLLAGVLVVIAPDARAGKPPKCNNCAPTITLPDGRVCTLVACGSDCAYQCPF